MNFQDAVASESQPETDGSTSVASEKTAVRDPEQTLQTDTTEDVPPDGGYGWVCVACIFLINAHTWGVNSSYGVFLAHYLEANTFPGATPLHYAFVGGLSISMAFVLAPLATFTTRKFGTKTALFVGVTFEMIGLLGASWATEIWHLFLTQGLAFGFGLGFLFVSSVGIIPQWFVEKRSFANSIGAAGSGIGGLVYSLVANAIIQSLGLGWAFRILAIISCVVNVICVILIKDRNKHVGAIQIPFDITLLKRPQFLLVLAWGFFSMLGYIALLFSLPSYARSVGLSAKQGSILGAVLNLGQGIGRPTVGYFSDAFGRINMAGTCTFLAGLFCFVIWIFAKEFGVLVFFALIVGTMSGTFWATIGPVGAEVVGLQILPSALSLVWLALVLPCTFAEPIALQLRRTSGNIYLDAQIFTACMYVAAALCMWILRASMVRERQKKMVEKVGRGSTESGVLGPGTEGGESGAALERVKTVEKVKGLWSWERI
ncbi:hypothetical protein HYFRA_00012886 [Hymenoscyphus fraxineus]|uniref:MFS general substrate transporter n=1 Tax=Hymenoscyphus fraxineus TaxID=746836 RepID=A0A9N9L3N4_9HELO|nr:hypothetical protein HYFRA_00012886 [Hymenoscyphus fraxineus]